MKKQILSLALIFGLASITSHDQPQKIEFTELKPKIIINSILALIFIYLTFKIDWLFIIPAAILAYLNQKEIMKK